MSLKFEKLTTLNLKNHPTLNEKWVQDRIAEDPSLLGLGSVELKDRERIQPRSGRLDLLFQESDGHTRYEVEIQLGKTDESHIIRTIEYWDIERKRYPQYDHVAVIVAEEITKVVREMYGVMVAEKADRVVIVTSGTYTQEAQGFAKGKPILLIDGKALAQHIREVKGEPAVAPAAATAPAAKPVPQQVLSVQTQAAPACPKCGSAMVLRTAKKGANAGGQFWGCSRYPECRGIINVT
ncbi:MAG: restriction endonuclease [Kiritimatiellia bacterium]